MLGVTDLPAFIMASVLLILSPGPGTLAILGAAGKSRRAGFAALAGTSVGDGLLMFAASIGAAALLASNPLAFKLLRYGGGAYLMWLGAKALMSKEHGFAVNELNDGSAFKRSLLVTLLNPKAIVFFMAFFPQFLVPGAPPAGFVMLAGIFIALNCLWQAFMILMSNAILSHMDAVPRFALMVNRLLGLAFIIFGLRLLTSA